jgi:hypothetical protein
MVDRLDLPAPGRLDLDPGLREGLDDVRGQIGPHPSPERRRHLVRQLGEPARLAPARVPLAEQLVQHLPVHVGAPRQPRPRSSRRHQHARRLGGREQPHPVGVRGRVVPSLLVGVHLDELVPAVRGRLGARRARTATGLGGALRRIRRYGPTAAAGPGRRPPTGARRAVPRGRAAGSRRPPCRSTAPPARPRRAARIDLGRRPPHPPRDVRPGPHGLDEIRLPQDRSGGQPVGAEGGELGATVLGRGERPAVGHDCESRRRV